MTVLVGTRSSAPSKQESAAAWDAFGAMWMLSQRAMSAWRSTSPRSSA
jgi:hypothetical protein